MTTKGSPARWQLPSVIDPAETVCYEIEVPNDPHHIAAFRGAMLALGSAYNWADDPAHTAVIVAKKWRDVIENMGVCGAVQTKIRAGEGSCELQWSYDNWVTYDSFDMSVCVQSWIDSLVPGMISSAIAADLASGALGPGGQPGPASPPAAGQCQTYHAELRANDQWLIPSPLNAGDTVHIVRAYGGATDGAFLWYCGDGKSYILGLCVGDNPFQPTDPYQAGNHMQLIGAYGYAGPIHYFDPLTSVYTIPSGVTNQQAWIQLNDAPFNDNRGVITFDIEVCSAVGENCWEFDFTASQAGFVEYLYPGGMDVHGGATWHSGLGWLVGPYSTYQSGAIRQTHDFGYIHWTHIQLVMHATAPQGAAGSQIQFHNNTQNIWDVQLPETSGDYVLESAWDTTWPAAMPMFISVDTYVPTYLVAIRFYGVSAQPESTTAC